MYRYIGNKTKLTDVLLQEIRGIIGEKGKVSDLMCGTASVSVGLKKQGYEVVASDVMTYAYYHAVVNLLMNTPPTFEKLRTNTSFLKGNALEENYPKVIEYLNNIPEVEGYFYREFSPEGSPVNGSPARRYFTGSNAKKIDAIRETIRYWEQENYLSKLEVALLKHNLILSVNPIANISGTYGHYHSKFIGRSLTSFELKDTFDYDIFSKEHSTNHTVLQGYAEDLAKNIEVDLCYIDPPYMKRQYAANYHILETLARGDEPDAAGLSGLRPWRDQYSDFCSKVKIRESFSKIIRDIKTKNILVSYSEDGLLKLDELVELFTYYGKVSVKEIKYKRFKSNNSALNKEITEYLIWIEKNKKM
ncbi:DNA adenine methylase [Paenibacillus sp. CGMCC 1.18879]|uniref:DNA adenine methylase n=1 Tax=Paenibacillus sp. CGMCC 1.18879 TaxID=2834466 RepID=UPI001CA9CA13|nr:DNA adenine methylase [Paenibacillus sp. CGMCC 1.18879]MBY9078944.1 DNA adenine methylase [Paenibacillus sp. CGMCC 1.18879]